MSGEGFDYAHPVGDDIMEWRHNARKTALYEQGDMVLVWVNEADLNPLRDRARAKETHDYGN